jgi:hypothetical protein
LVVEEQDIHIQGEGSLDLMVARLVPRKRGYNIHMIKQTAGEYFCSKLGFCKTYIYPSLNPDLACMFVSMANDYFSVTYL